MPWNTSYGAMLGGWEGQCGGCSPFGSDGQSSLRTFAYSIAQISNHLRVHAARFLHSAAWDQSVLDSCCGKDFLHRDLIRNFNGSEMSTSTAVLGFGLLVLLCCRLYFVSGRQWRRRRAWSATCRTAVFLGSGWRFQSVCQHRAQFTSFQEAIRARHLPFSRLSISTATLHARILLAKEIRSVLTRLKTWKFGNLGNHHHLYEVIVLSCSFLTQGFSVHPVSAVDNSPCSTGAPTIADFCRNHH